MPLVFWYPTGEEMTMVAISTEAVAVALEAHFVATPVDYMEDGFRERTIRNGRMASACHLFLLVASIALLVFFCYFKLKTGSNSPAIWKAVGCASFCGLLVFLLRRSSNRFSRWLDDMFYEEELAKAAKNRKDWLMSLLAIFREQDVLDRLEEDKRQIGHVMYANRLLILTSLPLGVAEQVNQALLQSLKDNVNTIHLGVSRELSVILEANKNLLLYRGYGVTPGELDVVDTDEEDCGLQVRSS